MGDCNITLEEAQTPKDSKNSIETLHAAKPSEDVSIKAQTQKTEETPNVTSQTPHHVLSKSETPPAEIETLHEASASPVTETQVVNNELKTNAEVKQNVEVVSTDFLGGDKQSATIFSVGGSASGRITRRRDHTTVFPAGCMGCKEAEGESKTSTQEVTIDKTEADDTLTKKIPSEVSQGLQNNASETGLEDPGLRRVSSRKKDGNPLLGTGYDDKTVTSSKGRVPPGGYSQGLW